MKALARKLIADPVTLIFCVFVFVLPLNPDWQVIPIYVIILFYLVTGGYRRSMATIKTSVILRLSCIFFLLHLAGMSYTADTNYGWKDVLTKLPFFLFPVVLSGFAFTDARIKFISRAFIVGMLLSSVLFFIFSVADYSKSHDIQAFFYKGLSHSFHPTYLSFYINLALLFILNEIFKCKISSGRIFLIGAFVILNLSLLLLSSRTATMVCYGTILSYPLCYFGKRMLKASYITTYILSAGLLVLFFFGVLHFNNRYTQVEQTIENHMPDHSAAIDSTKTEQDNSTNSRLRIWTYTWQLIKKNPLIGVGTGDAKDELEKTYKENNYEFGIEHHLNSHNQFMHTAVALGGIGVVCLLWLLISAFVTSFRSGQTIYFLFIIVIVLNCMTESILERQTGILFFTFFNTIFCLKMSSPRITTVS